MLSYVFSPKKMSHYFHPPPLEAQGVGFDAGNTMAAARSCRKIVQFNRANSAYDPEQYRERERACLMTASVSVNQTRSLLLAILFQKRSRIFIPCLSYRNKEQASRCSFRIAARGNAPQPLRNCTKELTA
jgi:hypothetical protein